MVGEVDAAVEEGVGVVELVGGGVGEVAGQGTDTKTRGKATQNTQNQRGKKTLNIASLSHVFKTGVTGESGKTDPETFQSKAGPKTWLQTTDCVNKECQFSALMLRPAALVDLPEHSAALQLPA